MCNDREILMRMVKKAENELKKKAFPRVHKRFINLDEVEFEWHEYTKECYGVEAINYSTLGDYQGNNDENVYKIRINKNTYDKHIKEQGVRKTNRKFIDALKHEMIHHYVEIKFERYGEKIGWNRDASPIFLSMLCWLCSKEVNGYYNFRDFKISDMYKKIMKFEEFIELFIYLKDMQCKYREVFEKLKFDYKDDYVTIFKNKFAFSYEDKRGFRNTLGYMYNAKENESGIKNCKNNSWGISWDVKPSDIERLYLRKRYSNTDDIELQVAKDCEKGIHAIEEITPKYRRLLSNYHDKKLKRIKWELAWSKKYLEHEIPVLKELEINKENLLKGNLDILSNDAEDTFDYWMDEYECEYDGINEEMFEMIIGEIEASISIEREDVRKYTKEIERLEYKVKTLRSKNWKCIFIG